jgi:hypothetical protein
VRTINGILFALLPLALIASCSSDKNMGMGDSGVQPMPDATMQGCPNGYTQCGDTCAPLKRDPENCGMCGKKCNAGEVCVQGGCALTCGGNAQKCGNLCINTKSDPANCGMCGQKCPDGQVCSAGKCATSCQMGFTDCSGACLDLQTDDDNCGMCNSPCDAGQHCVAGKCTANCQMGWTSCPNDGGTTCVDLTTDGQNCGMCGKQCAMGEFCSQSMCGLGCFGGTTKCGNKCVDLMIDPQNCGACNTPCNGTCFNGMCCSGNLVYCNGCTNLKTDANNCGGCGIKCGGICNQGTCCNQNEVVCNGQCSNTNFDPQNCGGCNKPCPNNLPACVNGVCSAAITVLVCGAPSTVSWNTDVQNKLIATGAFSKVDVMQCNQTTPTLAQLQAYQSVLVFSDTSFANAGTLGDNLADYVTGGGYAVVATFANASVLLGGKWISQNFNLIAGNGQTQPGESNALIILDNSSPLVVGVSKLTASSGYQSTGGAVNGGVVVAEWGDGAPLIIRGVKNGKNRAELNFYPPSSTSRNDFWNGDGATIMKNALLYR